MPKPLTDGQRLPVPPKAGDDWLPIIKLGKTVPFGYDPDEKDPHVLQPNVFELEALEEAKKLLKDYSSRTVAQWLTEKTDREISHQGLLKRVKQDSHRKRSEARLRYVYKRLEETARAIEKAQNKAGAKGVL